MDAVIYGIHKPRGEVDISNLFEGKCIINRIDLPSRYPI